MRGTKCKNSKHDVTPIAESSFTELEAAAVVEMSAANTTGAIPKHKQHHKKRTKPTSSSAQLKARNMWLRIMYSKAKASGLNAFVLHPISAR